jgi:hypothetical protein
VVQTNVENRFGLTVFLIRELAGFELNGLAVDGNLWHALL